MPAKDVATTVPATTYKTRVNELVCRNPKPIKDKRVDFYLDFMQVASDGTLGQPMQHAMASRPVLDLLDKTFPVPDGNGGTLQLTGAQVMEWLDLLGEEVCTENHAGMVARFIPTAKE